MKKSVKVKSLEMASKIILNTAVKEASSACLLIGYQPKMPTELRNLRKFQ